MGVPVLLGLAGEAADIVLREQVGEVFEPEDAGQLVAGVLRLRDDVLRFQALRANALRAAPSTSGRPWPWRCSRELNHWKTMTKPRKKVMLVFGTRPEPSRWGRSTIH